MDTQSPLLDLDQLKMLVKVAEEKSVTLLQETLDLFIQENQSVFKDLLDNLLEKDSDWVSHKIHYIGGCSSNIGLLSVAQECKKIELLLEKECPTPDEKIRLCQRVRQLCLDSIDAYQNYIDALKN